MKHYKNLYKKSSFLAIFKHGKDTLDEHFSNIVDLSFNTVIKTEEYNCYLFYSSSDMLMISPNDQIILLICGEVYNKTHLGIKQFLIEEYTKLGAEFIKNINGSFSILIIDKAANTILISTDRVNSKKVFFSKCNGKIVISNSIYVHPLINAKIDKIAVACYLANGVVLNNRTLFEEVKVLDRACIHQLKGDKLYSNKYWSYEFNNSYVNISTSKLKLDLSDLLIESVKLRLDLKSNIYLSLSAGYDATSILGILGSKLKIPNVRCFSYAFGKATSDSDEYISAKMAKEYNYDHRIISSYKGNLISIIKNNAKMGQGLCNFCDEVDAWDEIGKEPSSKHYILYTGDECFGWTNCALKSDRDVLNSVLIYKFDVLNWLKDIIDADTFRIFYEGLDSEIRQIMKRCPPSRDFHDVKDFLYLDQRLHHMIMPWRENFAGIFFKVANPFLDNMVLDFMMNLPSNLRCGKVLFKDTVVQMFPELFKFKRALFASYDGYWENALTFQRSEIESLVNNKQSDLDEIIPAEVIINLLQTYNFSRPTFFENIKSLIIKKTKRFLKGNYLGGRIAGKLKVPQNVVNKTIFLKRMLVLRFFLAEVDRVNKDIKFAP